MIDDIRRRQIDEVLNYDRDMNLRVLALQRKQVAKMEPEDEAQVSMQQETIDASNSSLNSFMVLLDKRRADVHTLIHWSYNGNDKIYGNAMNDLGRISDVIDAYNTLMSPYINNSSAQTKGVILSSVRKGLNYVSEISRGLQLVMHKYSGFLLSNKLVVGYIKNTFTK